MPRHPPGNVKIHRALIAALQALCNLMVSTRRLTAITTYHRGYWKLPCPPQMALSRACS